VHHLRGISYSHVVYREQGRSYKLEAARGSQR
jgi:hypothetical protein